MTAELLTDPNHIRQDLQYIATAIRHDWDIPEQLLSTLPKVAGAIAIKGKPSQQVAAMKVLLAMKEQNDKRDQPPQKPQTTINVGVKVENNSDTGRNLASQIVKRIRLERVSGNDT